MTQKKHSSGIINVLIVILLVVIVGLAGLFVWRLDRPNRNALAIGAAATVAEVNIEITPPIELDELSRGDIYDLRRQAINQYPELIAGNYRPSDAVFRQIVSGRPWWGTVGQFYHGSGERSIEGPSEESRFILNPYLLVMPEFFGLSYYGGNLRWDTSEIPQSALQDPNFPFYCTPESLVWYPPESRAELTIDVTACRRAMNEYTRNELTVSDSWFDLFAYNARDLNLTHIYVDYAASSNISKDDKPTTAYANPQFIHRGNSCGYEGGCNNMSPVTPPIDTIFMLETPARAEIYLWRDAPASVEAPPDMRYTIVLE